MADVTTSPAAGMPNAAELGLLLGRAGRTSCWWRTAPARPGRSRATASAAPGIGWSASHTTPSRSSTHVTGGMVTAGRLPTPGCRDGRGRFGGRPSARMDRGPLPALPRHPLRPRRRRPRPGDQPALRRHRRRPAGRAGRPRPAQRRADRPARRRGRRATATTSPATCSPPGRPRACSSPTTARPSPSTAWPTPTTPAWPAHTTGVIGALELSPPGTDILPHEHTTPKAKSDRLDLLRPCRANTLGHLGPVAGQGPDRPAAGRHRADRRRRRRRGRGAHRVGRRRPQRLRRHRRGRRRPAGGHRRRPPPLRDLARLPAEREAADGDAGDAATPRLPGRAGRGRADRARHPPARRRPARPGSTSSPPSTRGSSRSARRRPACPSPPPCSRPARCAR